MAAGSIRCKLEPLVLAFLRIYLGVVMAAHGWLKIQDFGPTVEAFTKMGMPAPKLMVMFAIAGEFGGGLGLIVGLLTPLAALGVFITMAVAVFKVHWANGLFAKDGGFEFPGVLMFAALYFIFRGAGPISLDGLFCRGRSKQDAASNPG
ncbi:MAG: DoxX family protein [bacterium]|nr:DoxX family protein [bacterium]